MPFAHVGSGFATVVEMSIDSLGLSASLRKDEIENPLLILRSKIHWMVASSFSEDAL